MSVQYEIRERFCTNQESLHNPEAQHAKVIMQRQLALLFAKQLCTVDGFSDVHIAQLHMEIDGIQVDYSAKKAAIIPLEVQDALQQLSSAASIVIDIEYNYFWRMQDDHLAIGPFELSDYLEVCGDDLFGCLDFVMHNNADGGDGISAGTVAVYGQRNTSICRGVVETKEIHELPRFGSWRSPGTAIIFDSVDIKPKQERELQNICESLMAMSDADEYFAEDGQLTFALNNLSIADYKKLDEYIKLCSKLLNLLNPDPNDFLLGYFIHTSLLDESDHGPNIIEITLGFDGKISLAAAFSGK